MAKNLQEKLIMLYGRLQAKLTEMGQEKRRCFQALSVLQYIDGAGLSNLEYVDAYSAYRNKLVQARWELDCIYHSSLAEDKGALESKYKHCQKIFAGMLLELARVYPLNEKTAKGTLICPIRAKWLKENPPQSRIDQYLRKAEINPVSGAVFLSNGCCYKTAALEEYLAQKENLFDGKWIPKTLPGSDIQLSKADLKKINYDDKMAYRLNGVGVGFFAGLGACLGSHVLLFSLTGVGLWGTFQTVLTVMGVTAAAAAMAATVCVPILSIVAIMAAVGIGFAISGGVYQHFFARKFSPPQPANHQFGRTRSKSSNEFSLEEPSPTSLIGNTNELVVRRLSEESGSHGSSVPSLSTDAASVTASQEEDNANSDYSSSGEEAIFAPEASSAEETSEDRVSTNWEEKGGMLELSTSTPHLEAMLPDDILFSPAISNK